MDVPAQASCRVYTAESLLTRTPTVCSTTSTAQGALHADAILRERAVVAADRALVQRQPAPAAHHSNDDSIDLDMLVLSNLRRLYGPGATPSSPEQLRALKLSLTADDLLFVAPTGAGKTAVALLGALVQPGRTLVWLVPYAALGRQAVRICRDRRISVAAWPLAPGRAAPSVLVLSVELIEDEDVFDELRRLHEAHDLTRLVMDEVHVLKRDATYRVKVRKSDRVRRLPVPVTCLTATLTADEEVWVRDVLLRNVKLQVVRMPTVRSNLVVRCKVALPKARTAAAHS